MKNKNPFDELIELYKKEEYLLSKMRLFQKPKATELFNKVSQMNYMEKVDWMLMNIDQAKGIGLMLLCFAREMWEDGQR